MLWSHFLSCNGCHVHVRPDELQTSASHESSLFPPMNKDSSETAAHVRARGLSLPNGDQTERPGKSWCLDRAVLQARREVRLRHFVDLPWAPPLCTCQHRYFSESFLSGYFVTEKMEAQGRNMPKVTEGPRQSWHPIAICLAPGPVFAAAPPA